LVGREDCLPFQDRVSKFLRNADTYLLKLHGVTSEKNVILILKAALIPITSLLMGVWDVGVKLRVFSTSALDGSVF
jgi:hypothetical protein